jgi:hypothetical protein
MRFILQPRSKSNKNLAGPVPLKVARFFNTVFFIKSMPSCSGFSLPKIEHNIDFAVIFEGLGHSALTQLMGSNLFMQARLKKIWLVSGCS